MKGTAYYNEHDPFAAAWLRELINDGLIAPGEVDERDIQDVAPDELRPFRQVHLFAGIGIWSAALRGAGWRDDRPVLTVSCPCQPFSAAGKGAGFADERHLWPAAFHLISELGAPVVFGEQVASADGRTWLDLVSADMEAAAYTGGAFDLCSAGFGAPNIRQRLYFVWLAQSYRQSAWRDAGGLLGAEAPGRSCGKLDGDSPQRSRDGGEPRGLDDTAGARSFPQREGAEGEAWDEARLRGPERECGTGRMADADEQGSQGRGGVQQRSDQRPARADCMAHGSSGPVNGFWRDADWLGCRDGKWRPAKSGTVPLATGYPNRVGLLRGAGNSLNKEVAQGFIATVRELIG